MRSIPSSRLRRALAGLALTALAVLHAAGRFELPALNSIDRQFGDARQRLQPVEADPRIVIVDVDEASVAELGHWPWTREQVAQLVQRLAAGARGGAAVIGFGMPFAEPAEDGDLRLLRRMRADPAFAPVEGVLRELSASLDHEAALAGALRGRPVVLGYALGGPRSTVSVGRLPPPVSTLDRFAGTGIRPVAWDGFRANVGVLQDAAASGGFLNLTPDGDGLVRAVPLLAEHRGVIHQSLAVAMLRVLVGASGPSGLSVEGERLVLAGRERMLRLPLSTDASAQVPYAGRGGPLGGRFRWVPAADLLAGRVDPALFDGRIVLVGSSGGGAGGGRATPVGFDFPEIEIHASMIAGALDGQLRAQPPRARLIAATGVAVGGAVLALAMPVVGPAGVLGLAATALLGVMAADAIAWARAGLVLSVAAGLLLVIALAALNLVAVWVFEGRSRRAVLERFGQYLSPVLVERLASESTAPGRDEGEDRELTILFADVRGFTRIAETLDPRALREYLNRFLTVMTEVIHQHQGTVDKYIGDAVMAFWGAPIDDPRHADHAVAAALAMAQAVEQLDREFAGRGLPPLAIGIGVNTGVVRVGDMGSNVRRAYTVIGDAVNLAARFQDLAKLMPAVIVAGAGTVRAARAYRFRPLGRVAVEGRQGSVELFEPLGRADPSGLVDSAPEPGAAPATDEPTPVRGGMA